MLYCRASLCPCYLWWCWLTRITNSSIRGAIFVFILVLMGWSLLPNVLRPFKIYCTPPNLGIRTWICWLNFAQRHFFSGLRFFNEPEISDSGVQLKIPPGGLVLRIFTSWKNPSTSVGFEPVNLGSWACYPETIEVDRDGYALQYNTHLLQTDCSSDCQRCCTWMMVKQWAE